MTVDRLSPLLRPADIYVVTNACDGALVVPGEFGWDDVGSWEAMARFKSLDRRGDAVRGDVTLKDTEGCIVDWDQGPALIVGMRNRVIAGTRSGLRVSKVAQDLLGFQYHALRREGRTPEALVWEPSAPAKGSA